MPLSIQKITSMKSKEKISMLTCYDYSFAKVIDGKVDIILVGDSLGNVILGYDKTSKVRFADMLRHLKAVRQGAKDSLIVADLSFGSYGTKSSALKNAKKLIKAGADAVKPEGKPDIVSYLVKNNIPVMAHLGYLPQTGTPKIVGREKSESDILIKHAKDMEKSGAFALVLEMVPEDLAKKITQSINIPTIGIGAGRFTDGQVLVLYDLLGLYPDFRPKFARQYMDLKEDIKNAVQNFSADVKKSRFPDDNEVFR
jgi:3-methyl-2-oxobutanoate hydroxymethyltransferase